eukprot:CAMPEP_0201584096 /NCGR_PEP_ID=MMETSP0190_2-20130828/106609_1 /ASSEMBLY_ACC=CAM_ASM_000263 /TAXON_ID=37353 /ORGANISM="Rosalina sp." /LENGTH=109 /DNA_ID=CAMNT_0048027427 /DNA_START=142 /DNA_END=471 /DNA_ORIENTATION=+
MKNTKITIQQFIEWYSEEEERMEIKKLVQNKYADIKQIQNSLNDATNHNGANKDIAKGSSKKRLSGNHLSIRSNKEKSELLEWQVSNNSIVSVDMDDSDDLDESDDEMF